MSLSKREFRTGGASVVFDPATLGAALREACPELDFVLLMGSGRDGRIPAGGDLDLALGLKGRLTFDLRRKVAAVVAQVAPDVDADLGP